MKSVIIWMNSWYLRILIYEIGKIKIIKLINQMIRSDLPIFIDLWIDKSISNFID